MGFNSFSTPLLNYSRSIQKNGLFAMFFERFKGVVKVLDITTNIVLYGG